MNKMDINRLITIAIDLEQTHGASRDAAIVAAALAVVHETVGQYLDLMIKTPVKVMEPAAPTPSASVEAPIKLAGDPLPPPKVTAAPPIPPAPLPVVPAVPAVSAVTLDELRGIVQAASKAGKKDGIRALLATYNAAKLPDLDPATYPAVKAALEAL
jgi:hypothetical protein